MIRLEKLSSSFMIRLLFNDQACVIEVRGKGGGGRGELSSTIDIYVS